MPNQCVPPADASPVVVFIIFLYISILVAFGLFLRFGNRRPGDKR